MKILEELEEGGARKRKGRTATLVSGSRVDSREERGGHQHGFRTSKDTGNNRRVAVKSDGGFRTERSRAEKCEVRKEGGREA